jgi:hypothetical protein
MHGSPHCLRPNTACQLTFVLPACLPTCSLPCAGIILAASVLSAFDAGKRFMADSGEKKEKEKSE